MTARIILSRHVRTLQESRPGMAALEVLMIIGAILPIALLLLIAVREALKMIHSIIGNLVGSPLF